MCVSSLAVGVREGGQLLGAVGKEPLHPMGPAARRTVLSAQPVQSGRSHRSTDCARVQCWSTASRGTRVDAGCARGRERQLCALASDVRARLGCEILAAECGRGVGHSPGLDHRRGTCRGTLGAGAGPGPGSTGPRRRCQGGAAFSRLTAVCSGRAGF